VPLINESIGIIFILAGNAALWFWLEKSTKWKMFNFFPPLIFIYLVPGILSNTGVIPLNAPAQIEMAAGLTAQSEVLAALADNAPAQSGVADALKAQSEVLIALANDPPVQSDMAAAIKIQSGVLAALGTTYPTQKKMAAAIKKQSDKLAKLRPGQNKMAAAIKKQSDILAAFAAKPRARNEMAATMKKQAASLAAVAANNGTYNWMKVYLLPLFLVLLLLDVDLRAAIRVMGRGVLVMLAGTAGVVIGAPIAYLAVKGWLGPEAWKGFGALAGSWIGGTGNMAAVGASLEIDGTAIFSLAVIADHAVYLVWLPLLLASKNLAPYFHRFTGVSDEQLEKMKSAADSLLVDKGRPEMRHLLYLLAIGAGATWLAAILAPLLPEYPPVLSASTYRILLVTTFGLILSFTSAKKIPGSHVLAMALLYLFVARMGAVADVKGLADQALPFVAGAYLWILIHGAFLLLAAKLLKVDVHTAAIASAANIGGAASAPVVAAYHDERLVPVSILMALIGYAVGNYAAFGAAWLCQLVA
jgi:uncharacterized membrane protein